nr:hypothetical protein [Luteibacter rhizovicinus]
MNILVRTILFLTGLATPLALLAHDMTHANGPSAVVAKLYKDFAWEALGASDATFGAPLSEQPTAVLNKYFDGTLASLLANDAACVQRNQGDECNLGFNLMFASQDPSASDLEIEPSGSDRVAVSFKYPSDGETIRLEYITVQTRSGWRIKDIIYHHQNDKSLVRILSTKP